MNHFNDLQESSSKGQVLTNLAMPSPFQVYLGDSTLVVEVEKDFTVYGDELKFGGGKVTKKWLVIYYNNNFQ